MKTGLYRCLAILSILFLILLSAGVCRSEERAITPDKENRTVFNEIGFIAGVGFGEVTEGNYIPVPFILHLGLDMKRWLPFLERHRGALSLYMEPQGVIAFNSEVNVEAGIALGLKYRHPLTEAVSGYVLASVGPHYYSLQTADQANGLLFADTVGVGVNLFFSPGVALDVGYRFRHLSNAELAHPNGGIDNHFIMVGLSFFR